MLANRSPIQALLENLDLHKIPHAVQCSVAGNVERLLFAFRQSINLAMRYNSVVLMDSTYKTNRFRMPLFHIVGRTGVNKTFSIGFVFLQAETQENYCWTLCQ